jgi:nucleoside-diphosphate-sugar epimerase
MAQRIQNVVLVGASGNIGPSILTALLNSNFDVTVLSRTDSAATFPSTVKVIKTDYSESSLVDALKGQDAVIASLGGAVLDLQKKVIDAAVKAGVKRFIPSEFGSDTRDPKIVAAVPLFKSKSDVLEYAASAAASNPQFSFTGVFTGPFFDWSIRVGYLDFNLQNQTVQIWDDGNTKFSTSNLARVGQAAAAVLKHPAETQNKSIYIHSFAVSQNEILAALEKHTGKTWTKTHTTTQKGLATADEAFKRGDFEVAIPSAIQSITFGVEFSETFDKKKDYFNDLLGLPVEDLDASVQAIVG